MVKSHLKIQTTTKKYKLHLLMAIKVDKKTSLLFLVLDQIKDQESDFLKIQED